MQGVPIPYPEIGSLNWLGRRMLVATIGNSIAGNAVVVNGKPAGPFCWANSYLHYGFSYIRSTSGQIGADSGSNIDSWGTYGFSGGVLDAQSGSGITKNIIPLLPTIFAAYTDTPDVFLLQGICENDIMNQFTANVICNNIRRLIGKIQRAYPNALLVLFTPFPSGFHTLYAPGGGALSGANATINRATYVAVKAFIQSLESSRIRVVTPDYYLDTVTLAPRTSYTGNVAGPDSIHPNEKGALVIGKFNLKPVLAPYAFPFIVPTNPAESTTALVDFATRNPGYNCHVANTAAQVTNGTADGPQYWDHSLPASSSIDYTPGVTAGDGTIVSLTNALAPVTPIAVSARAMSIYSGTMGNLASIGTPNFSGQLFARIKITNAQDLQSFNAAMYYATTAVTTNTHGNTYQNSATTWEAGQAPNYPFETGDELTLYTLPVPAGSAATGIQTSMNFRLSNAAAIGSAPAVQVKAINVVKTPSPAVPW